MKTRSMQLIPFALFGLLALSSACVANAPDDESIAIAQQTIKANRDYMRTQVEQNGELGRIKIDLADARQFQFLDARLRASGITPDTAPSLHAKLNAARQAAIAKKEGKLANDPAAQLVPEVPRCDAFIVPEKLELAEFKTLTRGSCVAGAGYTYIDTYQFDEDDNAIAYDFAEDWADGVKVDLFVAAQPPATKAVFADGISYHETTTTIESYYYVTPVYANHLVPAPSTVTGTLTAPVDILPNGLIKYCLDRNQYNADCDYEHGSGAACNGSFICEANLPKFEASPLPFNGNLLYMPMSGYSAPVVPNIPANPYIVEQATAWLTLRNAGATTPPGGFCTKDLTGSSFIKIVPEAGTPGRAKVVIDPKAPSLGNANWPDHCSDNGRNVDLNIEVKLRQQQCNGPRCAGPTIRWTTLPTTLKPNAPPMQIWWGCLAAGTKVTLENGQQLAIESLTVGQKVRSDEHGRALTVVGMSEGAERKPMVRVVDDRGNIATMTSTHAMPLGNGQVVQAQALQVGDRIETQSGAATVMAVERPEYESAVYNLTLGTPEELEAVGPEGTTLFADGIRVGDARMQGHLTERIQSEELSSRGKDIPLEKSVDYQYSMERMKRRAQGK